MPETINTTCPYCGVGCGLLVEPDVDGGWRIQGDPDHPSNQGRLCSKGSALNETLDLDGRLLSPMVDGKPTDWKLAIERVASRFRQVVDEHGPDAVAF
ncbi:MAG: nitrate reductase, partial [Candidatus Thiodiazotropha taylori]|nr:nitrate reductase [Candidatus Thiodiazotropha taylori]MCW4246055.1 nitrate reductase [Candidatus Thiodiazotropha taylori]